MNEVIAFAGQQAAKWIRLGLIAVAGSVGYDAVAGAPRISTAADLLAALLVGGLTVAWSYWHDSKLRNQEPPR